MYNHLPNNDIHVDNYSSGICDGIKTYGKKSAKENLMCPTWFGFNVLSCKSERYVGIIANFRTASYWHFATAFWGERKWNNSILFACLFGRHSPAKYDCVVLNSILIDLRFQSLQRECILMSSSLLNGYRSYIPGFSLFMWRAQNNLWSMCWTLWNMVGMPTHDVMEYKTSKYCFLFGVFQINVGS